MDTTASKQYLIKSVAKSPGYGQGRRYWGRGCHTPQKFKKNGKFGQTEGKFGQTKRKFCHKWQHLSLLAHPIKFGQFFKNSIFGRFNEHTPPQSKCFRDAPVGGKGLRKRDGQIGPVNPFPLGGSPFISVNSSDGFVLSNDV